MIITNSVAFAQRLDVEESVDMLVVDELKRRDLLCAN